MAHSSRKSARVRRSIRILSKTIASSEKRSRIVRPKVHVHNVENVAKTGAIQPKRVKVGIASISLSPQQRVSKISGDRKLRKARSASGSRCTCFNPPECPVHKSCSQKPSLTPTSTSFSVSFDGSGLSLTADHQWMNKSIKSESKNDFPSTSAGKPITLPAIFKGQLIIPEPYVAHLNEMVASQMKNYPLSINTNITALPTISNSKVKQKSEEISDANNNNNANDNSEELPPDEPTPPYLKSSKIESPGLVKKSCSRPRPNSNWSPVGKPVKRWVYLRNDERPVRRFCYNSIRHNVENDVIQIRDCVMVNSDDAGSVYVGKVAEFFEDPLDKTLRVSLVWYYSPQQTVMGRQYWQQNNELLASKHLDVIPADSIQDLVFVLTLNEYNRYVGENLNDTLWPRKTEFVPRAFKCYQRRRFMPPEDAAEDVVFFCRQLYDFTGKTELRDPSRWKRLL